jgi:hypothetical protein
LAMRAFQGFGRPFWWSGLMEISSRQGNSEWSHFDR